MNSAFQVLILDSRRRSFFQGVPPWALGRQSHSEEGEGEPKTEEGGGTKKTRNVAPRLTGSRAGRGAIPPKEETGDPDLRREFSALGSRVREARH